MSAVTAHPYVLHEREGQRFLELTIEIFMCVAPCTLALITGVGVIGRLIVHATGLGLLWNYD